MTRVVLASASPGRRTVLRQAGIDPLVVVSAVDEYAVIASLDSEAPPERVVRELATAKAEAVVHALDDTVAADCVVIGCDSMLYIDGGLRGKPASVADARRQWNAISGRSGLLYTGHCVIRLQDGEVIHNEVESACTTINFGTPSEDDLTAYLASGEPLRVAGGFTIDGLGGWFVDGIEGDPSNVIGLSLPLVRRLMARAGVRLAAVWAAIHDK